MVPITVLALQWHTDQYESIFRILTRHQLGVFNIKMQLHGCVLWSVVGVVVCSEAKC